MENLTLNSFSKVDEFTDPTLLQQNIATQLDNVILSKNSGKPTKRGGIIRFNSNDISGLADNRGFKSLHDVVDSQGNNLLLGQAGTNFYKSTDGTDAWTSIKSGLTDNLRTRLAIYFSKFFVTNNIDLPFITDGASVWNLHLEKPNVSGTTIAHPLVKPGADASFMDEGYYYYLIVYVDENGNQSEPSNFLFSEISGSTFTYFNDLPVPTDNRITAKKIYRTNVIVVGSKPVGALYLAATLDVNETNYNDATLDVDLDTSDILEYPIEFLTIKYLKTHKNRLFSANITRKNVQVIQPTKLSLGYATSGGNVADGVYKYKCRWVFDNDYKSVWSDEISLTVTGGSGSALVTVTIPIYGFLDYYKNFGFGIIGVELSRTKAGGSTFYVLGDYPTDGSLDTDGWVFSDNNNDTLLTVEIVDYDTATEANALYVSELDKFSTFKDIRYNVFPDDGDEITGIFDDEDGLLIFKKNSICKLFTSGDPGDWILKKLVEEIGSDDGDTIAEIEDAYYFMYKGRAYTFRSPRGYYQSENSLVKWISKDLNNTFLSVDTFHDAAFISKVGWYVLVATINSQSYLLVYDSTVDSWYRFYFLTGGEYWQTIIEKKHGDNRGAMILGNSKNEYLKYYLRSSLTDYGEADYAFDGLGSLALDDLDNPAYIGAQTAQIQPRIVTKTFISLAVIRLHKVIANYIKKDGYDVNFRIEDADSGLQKNYTDNINSSNSNYSKLLKKYTDNGFTGSLKRAERIKITFSGSGLERLNEFKLLYMAEDHGYRS